MCYTQQQQQKCTVYNQQCIHKYVQFLFGSVWFGWIYLMCWCFCIAILNVQNVYVRHRKMLNTEKETSLIFNRIPIIRFQHSN